MLLPYIVSYLAILLLLLSPSSCDAFTSSISGGGSAHRLHASLDASTSPETTAPIEALPMSQTNINKLESRLLKGMRETCQKYDMIENGDHIMVCVSGGKDSATMLHLLMKMKERFARPDGKGTNFRITAVHLNQVQPGYDGSTLVQWLDSTGVDYKIMKEDTYSIVKDKTPEGKTYCSLCSRLRRGILYSIAHDINATKIALGHHTDDAIETLLLNAVHAGQLKSMPARYYSTERDMHVIRPLMTCLEDDIREYASAMEFPILPCNLCGSQPDAHRAKMKMLVGLLDGMNPNARKNMITAMSDVRPSHLLDVNLREACGLNGKTGEIVAMDRARLVRGFGGVQETVNESGAAGTPVGMIEDIDGKEDNGSPVHLSFIESLL